MPFHLSLYISLFCPNFIVPLLLLIYNPKSDLKTVVFTYLFTFRTYVEDPSLLSCLNVSAAAADWYLSSNDVFYK
jgi:hypothetical protein